MVASDIASVIAIDDRKSSRYGSSGRMLKAMFIASDAKKRCYRPASVVRRDPGRIEPEPLLEQLLVLAA